jgi:uroporphyrinogen-III synthase
MGKQSSAPSVLLTRPPGQGARFAAELQARFGPLILVESPLIVPDFLPATLPPHPFAGVIFTSETGVEAARRLRLPPVPAFCVGPRTAAAAQAAGFAAEVLGGDAEGLVAALLARRPVGALLHLHGEDTRGAVAGRLAAAGLQVTGLAVYAQRPQPLSPQAQALLAAGRPVLVPLFSPRTAALFGDAARAAAAPLWVAALSPAVLGALAIPSARQAVAVRPEVPALLDAIATLLLPHRGA